MIDPIKALWEIHECLVRAQFLLNKLRDENIEVDMPSIVPINPEFGSQFHNVGFVIMSSKLAIERKLAEIQEV